MSLQYSIKAGLFPKAKAILKSILKPAENIELDIPEFIELWGPQKVKSFISIGANDGVVNDPLTGFIEKYNWKGIMVEPMPENFNKLIANLQHNKNLVFENVGIVNDPGVFNFYYIKDITDKDPNWYPQISSFDKETFYKNIEGENVTDRIGTVQIPGITFDELMNRNGIKQVDLIMIDTEGFDYKILSTIDLKKYSPKIIIFEYEWLTTHEVKRAKWQLRDAGYRFIFAGFDCIAIKR